MKPTTHSVRHESTIWSSHFSPLFISGECHNINLALTTIMHWASFQWAQPSHTITAKIYHCQPIVVPKRESNLQQPLAYRTPHTSTKPVTHARFLPLIPASSTFSYSLFVRLPRVKDGKTRWVDLPSEFPNASRLHRHIHWRQYIMKCSLIINLQYLRRNWMPRTQMKTTHLKPHLKRNVCSFPMLYCHETPDFGLSLYDCHTIHFLICAADKLHVGTL